MTPTNPIPPPILLVEDGDADFVAIRRAFRRTGLDHPLRRFDSGKEALDYLFREGEHADAARSPRPLAVLLDLDIPGLDGREVLRRIKDDPFLRRIPVIVLTGHPGAQAVDDCYALGANSYIRKPDDAEALYAAFRGFKRFWFDVAALPRVEEATAFSGDPAACREE